MSEEKTTSENVGNIKISEEVVAILADKAIREVEGIAGLSGSLVDSFAVVLGKKVGIKGIGVDIKDEKVTIGLHTVVQYGYRIPEVAWQAQETVKNTVESMTGLTVVKVNISVEGVEFPDDIKDEIGAETQPPEELVINQDDVVEIRDEDITD